MIDQRIEMERDHAIQCAKTLSTVRQKYLHIEEGFSFRNRLFTSRGDIDTFFDQLAIQPVLCDDDHTAIEVSFVNAYFRFRDRSTELPSDDLKSARVYLNIERTSQRLHRERLGRFLDHLTELPKTTESNPHKVLIEGVFSLENQICVMDGTLNEFEQVFMNDLFALYREHAVRNGLSFDGTSPILKAS